jgi:hypothetical protein
MSKTLLEAMFKEEASSASNRIASLVRELAETFLDNKNEISMAYVKEKLVREDLDKDQETPLDYVLSDIVSTLINNI